MNFWLAEATKFKVSCEEIGNCASKTPDLGAALTNIITVITSVIGMLAVVFIIVSGLQMVLSVGNAKRYQQAKMSLLYSVIGLGLAISAFAFVSFVVSAPR